MNSRERTLAAVSHGRPDRVPIDFWGSAGFIRKIETELKLSYPAFLDSFDVDIRYIPGPIYIGPKLRVFPDGSNEDIWGVRRRPVRIEIKHGYEEYQELAVSPLAGLQTVEEIDRYDHWPVPEWFDYRPVSGQCEVIRRKGRAAAFMGDRLNRVAQLKPAMYLRGVEQIMLDLALQPDLAERIFSRIRKFYLGYAERVLEAANGRLDIFVTGDDFGSQNGPLISPDMWVRFLGKGFADYAGLAKSRSAAVMHHTCGSVRPLIPLLVERGLDILQSLQPETQDMDPSVLKAEFGQKLVFHGGISIQRTMPFGTAADIEREVQAKIAALAAGGGYILGTAHNLQADVPVENALALLKAYHKYGRYN